MTNRLRAAPGNSDRCEHCSQGKAPVNSTVLMHTSVNSVQLNGLL